MAVAGHNMLTFIQIGLSGRVLQHCRSDYWLNCAGLSQFGLASLGNESAIQLHGGFISIDSAA